MNTKIIAIGAIAILLIAGVGAYVLMNDGSGTDDIDLTSEGVYLTVFGNANGDGTVDEDDIKAIEDHLAGDSKTLIEVTDSTGKKRQLADADCDGKIGESDIEMIKKMMKRETTYNILDCYGNFTDVPAIPQRIVSEFYSNCEILQLMDVQDRIVAADRACIFLKDYYLQGTDSSKVLDMGAHRSPDYEKVQELTPDIWLTYGNSVADKSQHTMASVVGLDLTNVDLENIYRSGVVKGTLLAGYLFDNEAAAQKYISWVVNLWSKLNSVSSQMAESDRPVVFYTGYGQYITNNETKTLRCFIEDTNINQAVRLAGGANLIDQYDKDLPSSASTSVDIEWVYTSDYEYLFVHSIKFTGGGTMDSHVPMHGYTTDDASEWDAAVDSISNMEIFKGLEDGNIVLSAGDFMNNASGGLLNAVLVATTINTDLFPDLDMKEIHQQYVDILGFDYDLEKHGVF